MVIAALGVVVAGAAQVDVIFSDNFDTSGGSVLNSDGGSNWTVEDGTVDVVASGGYSIDCLLNTGHCVDMDGSTGQAGEIMSIHLGPLAAEAYDFCYWLSGNSGSIRRWISSSPCLSIRVPC